MAVPFAEVIIHTVIDVLRHKTEDLENDEKVLLAHIIVHKCYEALIDELLSRYGPELEALIQSREEYICTKCRA